MCMDCGCCQPDAGHGDPRHITFADLAAAADASGITPAQAVANILATLEFPVPPPAVPGDAVKAAAPQRYVLGIAYQAGPDPRIQKGQDGGRDYFTEAELEKAAWSFLRNGPRVGLFHLDGTDDGGVAQVVESYIYRGPPWDLGNGIVAKSGDWLVGAVLSPKAWRAVQDGRISGFSPQGSAKRRTVRR